MMTGFRFMVASWGLILATSGCVLDRTGQSASTLYQVGLNEQRVRMSNLESQFQELDRRIGQIEEYNRSRGQSEIMRMENLDELRDEVARMRGEMEVLQHDFDQASLQEMGRAADADFRMLWLEDRANALEQALGMGQAPPPDINAKPESSIVPDSSASTNEPVDSTSGHSAEPSDGTVPEVAQPSLGGDSAETETDSSSASEEEAGTQAVVSASESTENGHSGDTPVGSANDDSATNAETASPESAPASEPTKIEPMALIRLAESHLRSGKEEAARTALDRYLSLYPDHEAVPQALYRRAESFYNEGEYGQAANGFKLVVDRYRETKWAPFAMLRQGECLEALERTEDAVAFYRALIQLWPKSKAAKEAKNKIQKLSN